MNCVTNRSAGRRVLAAVAVGVALAAAGCDGQAGGPKLVKVSGTVSYDGAPVPDGRIVFRGAGPSGQAYSGAITDGKYELMCEAGSMRVEVTAVRTVPGKFKKGDNGEPNPVPVTEMYIPAKYNAASTLKAEVKSGADIPLDLTK